MNSFRRLSIVALLVALLAALAFPATAQIPLAGKVTGPNGQPLAKARVLLLPTLGEYEVGRLLLTGDLSEPVAEAETNAAGLFELQVPEAGMWDVRAEKEGFAPQLYSQLPLYDAYDLPPVSLSSSVELEVRLRDAAGEPVVARVWVREGGTEGNIRFARFGQEGWHLAPHLGRTADDGTLRLPLARKKSWTLEAVAPGHVPLQEEVKAGARRLDKKLQRGMELALEAVEMERSEAVAEALVFQAPWTLPHALTDGKGHAVLQVRPGDGADVRVLSAAGHAGTRKLEAPDPEKPKTATVELAPPVALSGQAVNRASREPIAGALVWDGESGAWSTTDGAGEYELSVPRSMGWLVMAAARGYAGVRQFVQGTETSSLVFAMAPATAISGVVVDGEDQPVSGVELVAEKETDMSGFGALSDLGRMWHGRTDGKGQFRLRSLPLETAYKLKLSKPGYATTKAEIEELTGPRNDLRLVLPQGIRAAGQVVDESDQPISGAEVRLNPRGSENDRNRRIRVLLSGEDQDTEALITSAEGRFTADDLAVGSYDLEARAPGFAPALAPGVEIPEGATEMDFGVIVLSPAAVISGRVVDPAGNPISEAAIRAKAETERMPAQIIGFLIERESPKTYSGKDGSFKVEDQRPGDRVLLRVGKEGFVSATVAGVTAPTDEPLEVVLRPGSRVLGRVVDNSGAPVAQAMVQVRSESQGGVRGMGMGQVASTDDEGRFEIKSVEPGEVTVAVQAQGYRRQQLSGLVVPENGVLEGVEFTLISGATVRGNVTGSDGKPVVGAMVMIGAAGSSGFGGNEGFAQTDGEGNFEISGVSEGPKLVSANAQSGGRATAQLEVEENEHTVELVFEGGMEVSGRVVDSDGLPVAGARVQLIPGRRSFSFGMGELVGESDEAGIFRVPAVPAGTYTPQASKEGFASHRAGESFEVSTGPVSGLEIVLGRGATLTGRILGLEYDDMVRVEIRAQGVGRHSARPDFEGRYQISNVPVGTWQVQATVSGGSRQAKGEVQVEEGVGEVSLDLEFGSGYRLTGTVIQGEEPLAGAMIYVVGKTVPWNGNTTTAHDGTFSLDGLESGTYDLSVRNFITGLHHSQEIELTSDDDVLIELTTGRLAGYVRDASSSEPLEGAGVTFESSEADGSWNFGNQVNTDIQGYFSVAQMTEGSWKITASKAGYASAQEVVEVGPGTDLRNLDLLLEPTERLRLTVVTAQGGAVGSVTAALLDTAGNRVAGGHFETSQGGRLEITTAPKGNWEMLLQAGDSGVASLPVAVPGELGRVVLPMAGFLVVNVADLEGGGVARVRLLGADGRPYRWLDWRGNPDVEASMQGGSRTLKSVAEGTWSVTVTAEDGRSWSGTATVRAGETVTLDL